MLSGSQVPVQIVMTDVPNSEQPRLGVSTPKYVCHAHAVGIDDVEHPDPQPWIAALTMACRTPSAQRPRRSPPAAWKVPRNPVSHAREAVTPQQHPGILQGGARDVFTNSGSVTQSCDVQATHAITHIVGVLFP